MGSRRARLFVKEALACKEEANTQSMGDSDERDEEDQDQGQDDEAGGDTAMSQPSHASTGSEGGSASGTSLSASVSVQGVQGGAGGAGVAWGSAGAGGGAAPDRGGVEVKREGRASAAKAAQTWQGLSSRRRSLKVQACLAQKKAPTPTHPLQGPSMYLI